MKISEFIEQFNELNLPYPSALYKISATKEESFAHGVVINVFKNNKFAVTAARLPEGASAWDFYGGAPFSPKMLELMVELAKTPPEDREDDNRYVILNGKPFLLDCSLSTRLFLINDDSLSFAIANINNLADFSYTKEELEQLKATLPKELQDAVDMLTVTVSEVKKIEVISNDSDEN